MDKNSFQERKLDIENCIIELNYFLKQRLAQEVM